MEDRERPRRKPTPALLANRSFPEVADALRTRVDEIVQAWTGRVHRELPAADRLTFEQLRDDVPDILAMLADALADASEEQARRLVERLPNHGKARVDQGYDESELMIEFRLLRQAVVGGVEAAMPRPLTTEEHLALDMGIDVALHQSMMAFIDHQKAKLRAANETEARFLAYLTHDLRNNLGAVTLALRLLHDRLAASPEFAADARDVQVLEDGIRLTLGGMDRLLQAEYLRKGSIVPREEAVRLRSLATAVVGQFARTAEEKGIALAQDVPPDAVVRSDPELLYVILQNLVHNAVKYSPSGAVRLRAELRAEPAKERWVLSVSDEGPGIAPEHLSRIFDHFRRGETLGEPGVGLGLAIAARAARLLGADLSVHSEGGAGCTFSLALPESSRGAAGDRCP